MKTNRKWRVMLMALALVALSMVTMRCDDDEPAIEPNYTITGNATGNQVVPAVDVTGSATIGGEYNPDTHVFTYRTEWTGLTGAPTGGGIYHGAAGTTGSRIGPAWSFPNTSTETGADGGTFTLTDEQANQLTSGNWYYTYTTAANPEGEVRGQISASRGAD